MTRRLVSVWNYGRRRSCLWGHSLGRWGSLLEEVSIGGKGASSGRHWRNSCSSWCSEGRSPPVWYKDENYDQYFTFLSFLRIRQVCKELTGEKEAVLTGCLSCFPSDFKSLEWGYYLWHAGFRGTMENHCLMMDIPVVIIIMSFLWGWLVGGRTSMTLGAWLTTMWMQPWYLWLYNLGQVIQTFWGFVFFTYLLALSWTWIEIMHICRATAKVLST